MTSLSVRCSTSRSSSPGRPQTRHVSTNPDRSRNEERTHHVGFDIVGSLPLELVIQVARYLDCRDIVRCQRVSKRWRMILTCDAITAPFLRETLRFLDLDAKDGNGAIANTKSYFRWRHGLQNGRPVKKIYFPWPGGTAPVFNEQIRYHSRRLCYCIGSEKVHMWNLETGERSTWLSGEGWIRSFSLSDRYLLLDERDYERHSVIMTAWDIHTAQKLVHRFPDTPSVSCLVKDKVVMAFDLEQFPPVVYVWDLSSNLVRKITLDDFSNVSLLHLDTDRDVLVVFQVNWKKHPPEVQQTKWMWKTGELFERKQFCLSLTGRRVDDGTVYRTMRNFCAPLHNHKTVVEHDALFLLIGGIEIALHLMYDHVIDELSAQSIEFPRSACIDVQTPATLTPNIVYYWARNVSRPFIYDVANGTPTVAPYDIDDDAPELVPPWIKAAPGDSLFRVKLFGDKEVLGLAAPTSLAGFELWFFNPNFVPDLNQSKYIVAED